MYKGTNYAWIRVAIPALLGAIIVVGTIRQYDNPRLRSTPITGEWLALRGRSPRKLNLVIYRLVLKLMTWTYLMLKGSSVTLTLRFQTFTFT